MNLFIIQLIIILRYDFIFNYNTSITSDIIYLI